MDIFTTQLTRVVPVPIKPANLKVKALLKEAGAGKLKEEADDNEDHEYYIGDKRSDNEENEHKESDEDNKSEVEQAESAQAISKVADKKQSDNHQNNKNDGVTESKDGIKHLDLYV